MIQLSLLLIFDHVLSEIIQIEHKRVKRKWTFSVVIATLQLALSVQSYLNLKINHQSSSIVKLSSNLEEIFPLSTIFTKKEDDL